MGVINIVLVATAPPLDSSPGLLYADSSPSGPKQILGPRRWWPYFFPFLCLEASKLSPLLLLAASTQFSFSPPKKHWARNLKSYNCHALSLLVAVYCANLVFPPISQSPKSRLTIPVVLLSDFTVYREDLPASLSSTLPQPLTPTATP